MLLRQNGWSITVTQKPTRRILERGEGGGQIQTMQRRRRTEATSHLERLSLCLFARYDDANSQCCEFVDF